MIEPMNVLDMSYQNIIVEHGLPMPPHELILHMTVRNMGQDWWIQTESGWYWCDGRAGATRKWMHSTLGP